MSTLPDIPVECRVYDRNKFHAKAYITHAKLEVVGSQALVESSNFSKPSLTENIQLNVQRGCPAPGMVRDALERRDRGDRCRHRNGSRGTPRRNMPFDVYAKALQEFFRGHEL
jgi:hypothetical protein